MRPLPSHFYAIADPADRGCDPIELAAAMTGAGAKILQLRLKHASGRDFLLAARAVSAICHSHGTIFIVNDRVDIAMLSDADGVHLGQSDLPLAQARALLGAEKIIGISTHKIEQAREAERGGADYIGFGPMYPGGLKNTREAQGIENLRSIRKAVAIPIVAIGGIVEDRIPEILAAGADAAAIITDVVTSPNIDAKIRSILNIRRQNIASLKF